MFLLDLGLLAVSMKKRLMTLEADGLKESSENLVNHDSEGVSPEVSVLAAWR